MFSRVYLEITNVCNKNCSFCHGTKRQPRFMSGEEFDGVTDKLIGVTEYIYLHICLARLQLGPNPYPYTSDIIHK